MRIHVRLFAIMAQQAGTRELELEFGEAATLQHALAAVRERFPRMHWPPGTMVAVNQEYVGRGDDEGQGQPLRSGDELAIIPPVSGGAPGRTDRLDNRADDQLLRKENWR